MTPRSGADWHLLRVAPLLPLQLALLLPATIYLGNIAEFGSAPQALLRLLAIPALALTAVVALAGLWLRGAARDRYVAVMAALSLLVWLQGFVLAWDYGALDGSAIDWSARPWRALDAPMWLGALAAAVWFAQRLGRILALAATVVALLQTGAVAATSLRQQEALAERARPRGTADAWAQVTRFSSERNVLHLVLDSFQSDIFKEIVAAGSGADRYRTELDGFVFYEDNLGAFPYTYFALPAILGGAVYGNEEPKQAFIERTFRGRTLLNAAHAAGYEVDLATEPLMLDMMMHGRYTNAYDASTITDAGTARALGDATTLLELALFRAAPHLLKRRVYNDQQWLLPRRDGGAFEQTYYFRYSTFLRRLARELRADRAAPVYKFFHLMGPHAPIVASDACGYAGAVLQRVRPTVAVQSRCTLDFTLALLERMKAAGIYENALIVIMADHGGHIPPAGYELRHGDMDPRVVGLATPLLLVKLPGAAGPLRVSAAPTSILDVAPTLDVALGLSAGFGGVPLQEARPGPRTRWFHYYEFRASDYTEDYVNPVYQYRVAGSPYDPEAWVEERIRLAPLAEPGGP